MTEADKVTKLQSLTGETEQDILSAYLLIAKEIVINKAFPYGDGTEEVPDKYSLTQIQIAEYLLNKRGAEGERVHSENGISRTYDDGDIPPALLRRILPVVGVL